MQLLRLGTTGLFDVPEVPLMPALLATRVRVAQEGVCWQQGAALRVEREHRVHHKALLGTIR